MKYKTMSASISGTTCEGEQFTEAVKFELIPPNENEMYYGTGYYMRVKTPYEAKLVDVRYEKCIDVEILADRWIESWYGENAKDVVKSF